jgi:TRAP-type C4-dicarboxylate transport system permease large subunit
LSGTSIGQMFIAGIVPGLLLGIGLLVYAGWRAQRSNFPSMPKVSGPDRVRALVAAMPALMLPVIIVGGVKSGVFTMTESAAVAVAYAFVVGACHRELTFARIWEVVQFGVMVTLNVVIGMVTPPVGVCLFVVCAIAGKSIIEVSKEVLPMFFICLALLALVATVPAITLWLPGFSLFN